ncbi:MAG TPA: hypothetical protein VMR81_03880 [Patescibacteria group bacterium]|jgi:hypothetical protein|nr:hypothetical protein [Patescibacteria group bacterium]
MTNIPVSHINGKESVPELVNGLSWELFEKPQVGLIVKELNETDKTTFFRLLSGISGGCLYNLREDGRVVTLEQDNFSDFDVRLVTAENSTPVLMFGELSDIKELSKSIDGRPTKITRKAGTIEIDMNGNGAYNMTLEFRSRGGVEKSWVMGKDETTVELPVGAFRVYETQQESPPSFVFCLVGYAIQDQMDLPMGVINAYLPARLPVASESSGAQAAG